MSAKSEYILRSQMPGYWAVQIRLNEAAEPGARYLCHAEDDRAASTMAGRLMAAGLNGRGFDCFWIDPRRLERGRTMFPAVGASQKIDDAQDWSGLLLAHEASEAAHGGAGTAVTRTFRPANDADPGASEQHAATAEHQTERWEGEGGAVVRSRGRVNLQPQPKLHEAQGTHHGTPAADDGARRNMSADQSLYGNRWRRGASLAAEGANATGAKGAHGIR